MHWLCKLKISPVWDIKWIYHIVCIHMTFLRCAFFHESWFEQPSPHNIWIDMVSHWYVFFNVLLNNFLLNSFFWKFWHWYGFTLIWVLSCCTRWLFLPQFCLQWLHFRLFPSMYQHVCYKIIYSGKAFVTLTPFIGVFFSVRSLMILSR